MKHIIKPLVLASAMAALAGAAQADTARATLVVGGDPIGAFGYAIGNLQGSGTLNFSELLLGALSIANIATSAVSPGVLIETADTLAVTAPVFSLTGEFDSDKWEFTAQTVRTSGGALMTASALLSNGKKNAATTGGSLSVTDIKVDLTTQGIYATLTGANGVGVRNNVLVWNYGAIEGATTFSGMFGTTVANNTLSELTITDSAFNMFAQSLGLTAFGKSSMAGITDYGVMTAELSWDDPVLGPHYPPPPIPEFPEPSSYMLMGLGLVGLAFASRRARRA